MPPTDDWVVEQVLTISGTLVATLLCWLLAEYAQSRPRVRQAGRILGIVVLTGLCALGIMRCHSLFSGRNATAASMGRAESTTSASPPQTATVPQPARLPAQVVQAPGPQAPTPPPSPNARQRAPWRAWFPGGTPPKEPLVFVVDAGGTYDATVSDAVARPMGGVAGGLTPAFLTSGAFHRLVEGESREIEAAIGERLPDMFVGRSRTSYATEEGTAPGLLRVELIVQLRRYQFSRGSQSRVLLLSALGAGFTEARALAVACEDISRQIREQVR